ncbi:hypothetical protein BDZ91DRAFT_239245 [Kalaharituber pfeilii]|nr:hypothetical protein BDZ91DRAFT_239245 [Kalaharituber pfeilii]
MNFTTLEPMSTHTEGVQKLKDALHTNYPENRYLIRGVLECECVSCKRVFKCSCQDADELFQKIIGPEPAVLLLAILAYLGTTFMIHDCIDHGLRDHNLGNMSSFLMQQGAGGGYDLFHRLNYDLEEDCDQTSQEISQVLTEMITSFTRNFNEAKERFFPKFLKRDMDIRRFHQDNLQAVPEPA